MTPNSLPGFLRRSIRSVNDDYDSEDHADDNDDDAGEEIQPTAGSTRLQSLIPSSHHINNVDVDADAITNANVDTNAKQQYANDNNGKSSEKELEQDLERLALQVDDDTIDKKFRMVGTPHKLPNSPAQSPIKKDNGNVNTNANVNANAKTNTSSVQQMQINSQVKVLKQNKAPSQIQKTKEKQPQPAPQPLKTSKQSSISSSSSVSKEETNANATASTTMKTPETKNYKDIQFDKVISSPVVDIADLRKLSWNGIPVSLLLYDTVLVLDEC